MEALVDTSVLFDVRLVQDLVIAAAEGEHRLLIPALVLAERDFQVRRELAGASPPREYKPEIVRAFYATHAHAMQVLPLDMEEALEMAGRLAAAFPKDEDWQRVKAVVTGHDPKTSAECGATVDLYLRALASPDRPIVTKERVGRPAWNWNGAGDCVLSPDQLLARWRSTT